MTTILPPTVTLEYRRQRAQAAMQVLHLAIQTMQMDFDLITTLTVTGSTDVAGDTLLPDIALCLMEFREALDALPWPEEDGNS